MRLERNERGTHVKLVEQLMAEELIHPVEGYEIQVSTSHMERRTENRSGTIF